MQALGGRVGFVPDGVVVKRPTARIAAGIADPLPFKGAEIEARRGRLPGREAGATLADAAAAAGIEER